MKEYTKIQTLFKRDMANKGKIIIGDWSLPEFDYLQNNEWIFTEKVDGTNIRAKAVFYQDGRKEIQFGGRTDAAQIPATLVSALQALLPFDKFAAAFEGHDLVPIVLYGEGYGAKIQNGGNYRSDQSFILFDVMVGDWWLQRETVEGIGSKLGIPVVPIIGRGTLHDAVKMTQGGLKSTWGDFIAEGIVLRPAVELKTRKGDRLIGKIKHRDFVRGKL
jgi:hypothetical protein